ncbi:hypothetical protein ACHAXR_010153 [Thalassiosira sp. AJA248-18]
MTDLKATKPAGKRSPTFLLIICLLLISFLSIYKQEKLLQFHFQASNNGGHNMIHSTMYSTWRLHSSELLFGDATGSAKILLRAAQKKRPIDDEAIDHEFERTRCARYNLDYTPNTKRRRVFWGANIADDSWHAIATQAIETYGLFHTVAFIESNRTSMADERQLRFGESSTSKKILTESEMFGQAKVTVDYYGNEDTETPDTLVSLEREHAQRALILERWKKNGMTKSDIGYLSDTDETFSRDFIRAMQICDVPQFSSDGQNGHNKCAAPKVYGLVTIFEGSPECVSAEEIYHPALMIGECVDGIGDETLHPRPSRHRNLASNWRNDNYTYNTYYSALHDASNPPPPKRLPSNAYFPLWNAADYRKIPGGFFYGDDNLPLYVGYHIHNFFDDMGLMRKKYLTYGHAIGDALTKPLSYMNREVNLMVRCAKHNNTFQLEGSVTKKYKSNAERRSGPIFMRKGGLDFLRRANYGMETGGAVPLAFRIEEYVKSRHQEMVASVEKDERERLQAISTISHEKD